MEQRVYVGMVEDLCGEMGLCGVVEGLCGDSRPRLSAERKLGSFPYRRGVILTGAVFQAERRISRRTAAEDYPASCFKISFPSFCASPKNF